MKKIKISEDTYNALKDQIIAEENKVKEKTENKFEIKNKWTGEVIYSSTKTNYKDVIEEAVKAKVSLSGAYLVGVNLSESNLSGSNLRGVDLSGSNLCGVDLSESNLYKTNLRGSNLDKTDLRGVDLRGVEMQNVKFYGIGGSTKINKSQIDDLFKALGVIVID